MTQLTDPMPARRRCGTMDVHARLLEASDPYREARALLDAPAPALGVLGDAAEPEVVRIPVVVHVVLPDPATVGDEQVTSQLDVLNRDYRATNPDVSAVPAPFTGLVADARVEFALATTDPSGGPTSGITRTTTTVEAFDTDDAVKSSASGGADPWPADRYLNLWVCALGGGLLGYAQFPGGPPETDGVVILHSAFGTTGTATAPFDLGRTTTHEVGHWLNLFHIWGDDGSGCSGTDQVDDTPNQAGPNYGRPEFPHVTCDNGPDGDLFVDYMDYVDDAAMVMFTTGQVARMRATLAGERASVVAPAAEVPDPASGLPTTWRHSFEEDGDGSRVYRPADHDFPRARGRGGLELRPDGTWVELGPGAADAPSPVAEGTWERVGEVVDLRTSEGTRTARVGDGGRRLELDRPTGPA